MILGTHVCAVALALVGSTAVASANRIDVGSLRSDGFALARQGVPTSAEPSARAHSRTIYLNKNGVTVTPGTNDSRLNRSSVPKEPATIPAWTPSPELWAGTVDCLDRMFAPFDVTLTETDPGNQPHIEAVFGGKPALLGLAPTIGGISPISTSCNVVESSMVFVFTSVIPQDPRTVCEVIAQEIAHSYGLDHELLPADPMTYLRYEGDRAFQDTVAACGETTARPCGVDGSTCRAKQNSYALLLERLGAAGSKDDDGDDDATGELYSGDPAAEEVGCSAGRSGSRGSTWMIGLALAGLIVRPRRR